MAHKVRIPKSIHGIWNPVCQNTASETQYKMKWFVQPEAPSLLQLHLPIPSYSSRCHLNTTIYIDFGSFVLVNILSSD